MPGWTENLSSNGMLLGTSLLLAIGDVLRLAVAYGADGTVVHGRVIRVQESEAKEQAQFGVGVELVHASEAGRQQWLGFLTRFQSRELR
jgi:hypothetical protein